MEYISSLIAISCMSSLFIPMLKQGSKLRRYVAFSIGVICVYTVFSPIVSFFSRFNGDVTSGLIDLSGTENVFSVNTNEWILSETDDELRYNISQIIRAKFSIPVSKEMITLYYDKSDYERIKIIKTEIDLSAITVIRDLNEMQQYLSEMLLCECEVKVA